MASSKAPEHSRHPLPTPAPDNPIRMRRATAASPIYGSAARRFAKRALELDNRQWFYAQRKARRPAIERDLRDTALMAIIAACTSVEAAINELYHAHIVRNGYWFRGLSADHGRALSESWQDGTSDYSVVTKCHVAAAIMGKARFNFGVGSGQNLGHLIDLRNQLVHHKPMWIEFGKQPHESDDSLERRLNHCFPWAVIWENRGMAFRWNGCLGGGCAKWGFQTCESFKHDFFAHLNIGYPGLPAE